MSAANEQPDHCPEQQPKEAAELTMLNGAEAEYLMDHTRAKTADNVWWVFHLTPNAPEIPHSLRQKIKASVDHTITDQTESFTLHRDVLPSYLPQGLKQANSNLS